MSSIFCVVLSLLDWISRFSQVITIIWILKFSQMITLSFHKWSHYWTRWGSKNICGSLWSFRPQIFFCPENTIFKSNTPSNTYFNTSILQYYQRPTCNLAASSASPSVASPPLSRNTWSVTKWPSNQVTKWPFTITIINIHQKNMTIHWDLLSTCAHQWYHWSLHTLQAELPLLRNEKDNQIFLRNEKLNQRLLRNEKNSTIVLRNEKLNKIVLRMEKLNKRVELAKSKHGKLTHHVFQSFFLSRIGDHLRWKHELNIHND